MTGSQPMPGQRRASTRFPLFSRVRHPDEVRLLTAYSASQFGLFGLIHFVAAFYYSSGWSLLSAVVLFATAVFLVRHFGPLAVGIGLLVASLQSGAAIYAMFTRAEPAPDTMDGRGIILVLLAVLIYSVGRLVPVARGIRLGG